MCYWPPVRVLCRNHDVVILKSWKGTGPKPWLHCYLYKFKSSPPDPPVSTIFWIVLVPSSILPPPCQQPSIFGSLSLRWSVNPEPLDPHNLLNRHLKGTLTTRSVVSIKSNIAIISLIFKTSYFSLI